MRSRLVLAPALAPALALVLACTGCGADELRSEIVPGLELRDAVALTDGDHLVELVVHEGHVYAANSFAGVGAARLDEDGGLTVTEPGDPDFGGPRCTTVAIHAASDTLYCASDQPPDPLIERYDISEPGHPAALDPLPSPWWSIRSLEVIGDVLVIHHFDEGLWWAPIEADGSLGAAQQVPVAGNARLSVGVGARVITAFADTQGEGTLLRMFEAGTWAELDQLALAGPPIGLSADVDGRARVVVALGSAGVQVVELGAEAMTLGPSFHPPAVATHAQISDEVAVAFTLSGAFTWALGEGPGEGGEGARMFGFAPEGASGQRREGNMLHGLLLDGEVLAADWTWIQRWSLEPAGEVVALDVPRGLYVGTGVGTGVGVGGPLRWSVRNVGATALRAEFWFRRDHLLDVEVGPEAVVEVELPETARALFEDDPQAQLSVRVHDPRVPREGEPLSTSRLMIVQREADDPLPPAVGDPFPTLTLADRNAELFTLPLAEGTVTLLLQEDCWLLFPQLEDLAWLVRSGQGTGRGTPVIISDVDIYNDGFAGRWGLESLRLGLWGKDAPPEVEAANAGIPGANVHDALWSSRFASGSSTADYVIDEAGQIESLERMYRGEWSLVVPWPWQP